MANQSGQGLGYAVTARGQRGLLLVAVLLTTRAFAVSLTQAPQLNVGDRQATIC